MQNLLIGSMIAVTKNDSNVIAKTDAVWVGGAGDMAVTMKDGKVATIVGIQAGTLLPIEVTQIRSTNTDATDFLACYYE